MHCKRKLSLLKELILGNVEVFFLKMKTKTLHMLNVTGNYCLVITFLSSSVKQFFGYVKVLLKKLAKREYILFFLFLCVRPCHTYTDE